MENRENQELLKDLMKTKVGEHLGKPINTMENRQIPWKSDNYHRKQINTMEHRGKPGNAQKPYENKGLRAPRETDKYPGNPINTIENR